MAELKALFKQDGNYFIPTLAALGPWRPDALHGGAINALFARCLEQDGFIVAKMTLDILRRVPPEVMHMVIHEETGSRRLRWQTAELWANETLVARAQAHRIPIRDIDVPAPSIQEKVWDLDSVKLPDRIRHQDKISEQIGYPSFASHAIAMAFAEGSYSKPGPATAWLKLMLPVVEGEELTGFQRIAAAADYSGAANAILPFNKWSFMNTDLTLSITRPPVGEWMAVSSRVHSQRTGVGLGDALLHDREGPLGRSTQTQLIDPR